MSKENMNDQQNEIIPVEITPVSQELAPAAIIMLTTKDLQARILEETEQRKLITEFITQHMKEGVDYGKIKVKTRDGREVESKPSLFKPGSEKFCSLFHFHPTFERDNDTWEMAGKTSGLFSYKCNLVAANGAIVGEGRGAANLVEKQGWTVNNAIKIAEKRAQIDAVLRTGGLSDFFSQDLEDLPKEQLEGDYSNAPEGRPADRPDNGNQSRQEYRPDPNKPLQGQITEGQKRAIFGSIKRLGVSEEELKMRFGVEHVSEMTKQQASDLIDKLFKMKEW